MSEHPIFDATLADAPVNIWQASSIFPQPTIEAHRALSDAEWTYIGHPAFYAYGYKRPETLHPDYRDWSFINGIPVIRSAA